MRKSRGTEKSEIFGAVRAVLFGTIGGCLAAAALLAASAYIITSMGFLPDAAVPAVVLVASALSAFLAGLFAAKLAKKRGLPLGAAAGLLLFLLFLLAGLAGGEEPRLAGSVTRLLVMVLSGALGGYAGVSGKRR